MTEERKAVLVTGASGFVGRRLCERLKEAGARVIALGRNPAEGPWHGFIACDLSREGPGAEALAGIDIIFHLASKAHSLAETPGEAYLYQPVIVDGTERLLESAKEAGIGTFIYLSSVKAMGEGNPYQLPLVAMDETWPHTPQTPYGRAKAEAEERVHEAGLAHAVILRPTMVFGPGEKGNLPRMIEAVRRERFPPIPETGNRRSMIHVDDVVAFAIRAAQRPIAAGRTYILAHPDAVSTRGLYDAIRESLGKEKRSWSVPMSLLKLAACGGSLLGGLTGKRMPLDLETLEKLTGSAWYSGERAIKELDYTPRYSVRDWLTLGG